MTAQIAHRQMLLEIGTEELPPGALRQVAVALAGGIEQALDRHRLAHGKLRWYATPRRLAVSVCELALKSAAMEKRRRGPPLNACYDAQQRPTAAALGFAASCGVPLEQLEHSGDGNDARLLHRHHEPGRETAQLLPPLLNKVLQQLPIPQPMRWGEGQIMFIRPVHWVVLLLGSELIETELLGCKTGRCSRGHRLLDAQSFPLEQASSYPPTGWHVQADYDQRRECIRSQVNAAARQIGGQCLIEQELLEEVTALVEWPVPVCGQFPERFLKLPRELLIAALQTQQRFFPVLSPDQKRLMPSFISIANMECPQMDPIRRGNERVIVPRLADAEFFWNRDRRQKLEQYREPLRSLLFYQGLGSVYDKSERMAGLAAWIAGQLQLPEKPARRAAELCKCDLLTELVGEFPVLQGCAGGYYARHSGESGEVAEAIGEHYRPRFAGDSIPATTLGRILSLADKIDTLAGIFRIGKAPSAEKDPLGLRRAALGCVRILTEGGLALDLRDLTVTARQAYQAESRPRAVPGQDAETAPQDTQQLIDFMLERMRFWYLEQGIPTSVFEAVRAAGVTEPADFNTRIKAIRKFQELPEAGALITANKRIRNILRQGSPESAGELPALRPELLQEPAEQALAEHCTQLRAAQEQSMQRRDYAQALQRLAGLQGTIDRFFEDVLVMSKDLKLRNNRIALLYHLGKMFNQIADLSRL